LDYSQADGGVGDAEVARDEGNGQAETEDTQMAHGSSGVSYGAAAAARDEFFRRNSPNGGGSPNQRREGGERPGPRE
jgi:hypothetical protein